MVEKENFYGLLKMQYSTMKYKEEVNQVDNIRFFEQKSKRIFYQMKDGSNTLNIK